MASEDSDQFVSGFLPVHRLRDFSDLNQTGWVQMQTFCRQLNALSELLEVRVFRASQRELTEERDDRLHQFGSPTDVVLA